MARNLIFIAIALIAVVTAGPGDREKKGPGGEHKKGPGGKGGHYLPSFFKNISAEGKKEIGNLFKNESLTVAQVDTQLAVLAEKYGVSAAYKEHKEKEAAVQAEITKNTTTVIASLSSVSSKLSAIHENKDQTRKAQHDAIEALRKENRVAVDTIEFIRKRIGGGHHGGHKGGLGGKGKHGGKHGDKKGPKGGDNDEKNKKKTKEAPSKTKEAAAN